MISKSPNRLGGGFASAIAPVILAAFIPQPGTHVRVAGRPERNNRSQCRLHSQDIAPQPDWERKTGAAPISFLSIETEPHMRDQKSGIGGWFS